MHIVKISVSWSTAYRIVNTFLPELDKCSCIIAKLFECFHLFSLQGLRIVSPNF